MVRSRSAELGEASSRQAALIRTVASLNAVLTCVSAARCSALSSTVRSIGAAGHSSDTGARLHMPSEPPGGCLASERAVVWVGRNRAASALAGTVTAFITAPMPCARSRSLYSPGQSVKPTTSSRAVGQVSGPVIPRRSQVRGGAGAAVGCWRAGAGAASAGCATAAER